MPRVKQWTDEDRQRALEWVVRKAATGVVFRNTSGTVSMEIESLLELADPDEVAERLRESLTDEAWKRLLGALRQRKHQAEKDQAGADEADQDEAQQASECQQCRRYEAQILTLESDLASARSMGTDPASAIEKALAFIADLPPEPKRAMLARIGVDQQASAETSELEAALHAASSNKPAELVRLLTCAMPRAAKIRLFRELSAKCSPPADEPQATAADGTQRAPADQPPALDQARAMKADGASYRAIAAALNEAGVPTRSGKGQWAPGSVQALLRHADAA